MAPRGATRSKVKGVDSGPSPQSLNHDCSLARTRSEVAPGITLQPVAKLLQAERYRLFSAQTSSIALRHFTIAVGTEDQRTNSSANRAEL